MMPKSSDRHGMLPRANQTSLAVPAGVSLALQELRQAIAALYNTVTPDQVVVCVPEEGKGPEHHEYA